MEIKNEAYKTYMKYPITNIPTQDLMDIIKELSLDTIFLMGTEMKAEDLKKTTQAVIYVLKNYYGFMPLYMVAEAFSKGSIGNLGGTSKFNARNVNIWMKELQDKFQHLTAQEQSRQDDQRRKDAEKLFMQNQKHNTLFGTALSIKVTWVCQKRISADYWDNYTLDAIVEQLRNGETERTLTPKMIWKV